MIRLNITDEQGVLLGQVELSEDELSSACQNAIAAGALVWDIASEAGVR